MNEVFTIREGEWQVRLGNEVLSVIWNSKGAALAGMKTEMRRRGVHGMDDQCIWLRPTDAELERRTGEPHIDGWPLYSGLPPAA